MLKKVFHHKFEKSTSKFEQFSNKLMIKTQLAGPVSEILGIMVFCVLIWYGGNLVLVKKQYLQLFLFLFLGLAYNIITPAKSILKLVLLSKKEMQQRSEYWQF